MKFRGLFVVLFLTPCFFAGMLMADGSQVDCDNQVRIIQEDDSERIVCPYIIKQVCGTDGKTYSNECEICRHNLETGENVGKKFNGKCSKRRNRKRPRAH